MDIIKASFVPYLASKTAMLLRSNFLKQPNLRSKWLTFLKPCIDPINKDPTHHQRNQHYQIKMWENKSDPQSFGYENDDDKILARAFLSCS